MISAPFLMVVIPMYNEEIGAERCVREMLKVVARFEGAVGLLTVNDGSRDRTLEILEKLKLEGLKFNVYDQTPNQGYGKACLNGALEAHRLGAEFALFMDSDLTNDPQLIAPFLEILRSQRYDVVKASRYLRGGGMQGVPWRRQLPTIVGNRIARFCFGMGIADCTNGFRAVRLSMIEDMKLQELGFPSILEELYHLKLKGARGTEIPYTLTKRLEGDENSKFSYKPDVFMRYLKYCLKALWFRSISPSRTAPS